MTQITIKDLENGEIEISGLIPYEILEKYRLPAIKNISKDIEIQGFRKGHIPEKILIQKVGENTILEEAAGMILKKEFPKILAENKINALGRPDISITKLAKDNPLEFKVNIAIMPKIELPDYKTLTKEIMSKKETVEITDKEIEETINEIRKMRAEANKKPLGIESDDEKTKINNLPKLDDKFVKTLGDFNDVSDFKEKLKKNILEEKKKKVISKKWTETIEKITKATKATLPKVIIESELSNMISQFKNDIEHNGGTFEEYLKHAKKTEEDLKKEWHTDAETRAKSQLVLNEIALKEKIKVSKEEIDTQVTQLLEQYKDADIERTRIYVETTLTNEKVFVFLEKQGTTK